jgi:hypothetical protein
VQSGGKRELAPSSPGLAPEAASPTPASASIGEPLNSPSTVSAMLFPHSPSSPIGEFPVVLRTDGKGIDQAFCPQRQLPSALSARWRLFNLLWVVKDVFFSHGADLRIVSICAAKGRPGSSFCASSFQKETRRAHQRQWLSADLPRIRYSDLPSKIPKEPFPQGLVSSLPKDVGAL